MTRSNRPRDQPERHDSGAAGISEAAWCSVSTYSRVRQCRHSLVSVSRAGVRGACACAVPGLIVLGRRPATGGPQQGSGAGAVRGNTAAATGARAPPQGRECVHDGIAHPLRGRSLPRASQEWVVPAGGPRQRRRRPVYVGVVWPGFGCPRARHQGRQLAVGLTRTVRSRPYGRASTATEDASDRLTAAQRAPPLPLY